MRTHERYASQRRFGLLANPSPNGSVLKGCREQVCKSLCLITVTSLARKRRGVTGPCLQNRGQY
jgi:hypothetical protein